MTDKEKITRVATITKECLGWASHMHWSMGKSLELESFAEKFQPEINLLREGFENLAAEFDEFISENTRNLGALASALELLESEGDHNGSSSDN